MRRLRAELRQQTNDPARLLSCSEDLMADLKTLKEVIREEQAYIRKRRKRKWPVDPAQWNGDRLIGLALSGGGIRSAATNLGVLQGLAERGVLSLVDYLSTVSGGGYIGACLTSLLSNREIPRPENVRDSYDFGANGNQVEALFATDWRHFPFREDRIDFRAEPADNVRGKTQMDHIRTRASYLAPLARHFSPNVMRAVGSVFTSTFMSLLWFVLLIVVITASYMTVVGLTAPDMAMHPESRPAGSLAMEVRTANSAVSFAATGQAVSASAQKDIFTLLTAGAWRPFEKFADMADQRPWTVGVAFFSLSATLFFFMSRRPTIRACIDTSYYPCFFCFMALLLLVLFGGHSLLCSIFTTEKALTEGALLVLPVLFAGGSLIGVWLAYAEAARQASNWDIVARSQFHKLTGILLIGLLLTLVWAILPGFLVVGMDIWKSALLILIGFGIRSVVTTRRTAGRQKTFFTIPDKYRCLLLGLCTLLFTLLAVISVGNALHDFLLENGSDPTLTWQALHTGTLSATAALAFLLLLAFAGWVDPNKLSPHYFYRDRLAETFLRTATHAPTLLRDDAEMLLQNLHGNRSDRTWAARGPYLLMNATLNLTADQDLKAFNRKSDIFTFSRFFLGSKKTGYLRTSDYLVDDGPLKLARAMAISGAAVTSVMGMNTSLATSFACTIFGVRLGYWLPNFCCNRKRLDEIDATIRALDADLENQARQDRQKLLGARYKAEEKRQQLCRRIAPLGKSSFRSRFARLFKELVGHTTAEAEEIYLSDGGHSGDNLGIIPLLQRRVKVLLVSDSECDPDHLFDSFNSSLRNAYVDEGICIDISLDGLRKNDKGLTPDTFAIGRIYYPDQGPDQENWLVLFKNTMTGAEIAPIVNYREKSPSFPHESTGDQFFSEEQFESYRALGRFAVFNSFASEGSWLASCRHSAAKSSLLVSRAYAFLMAHADSKQSARSSVSAHDEAVA